MNEQKEFQPYIPADKVTPEITVASVVMGVLLSVVFGAANAYLGVKVGMTVSASIPAAVIAMGVIRKLLKKKSILESNFVQTTGSAGESVAAGAIFTLPALYIWASEGVMEKPGLLEISVIALLGGLLGVFFMVPLRNALIVREHGVLPYPEGTACAEVLLAGEEGGTNASTVFAGMGFAAVFKFIIDGLKAVPDTVSYKFKSYGGEIGTQIYPALLSVGYICGPRIASYMFAGGLLNWMVLVPMLVLMAPELEVFSRDGMTIMELYQEGGTNQIWKDYARYIGAGALAAGGIISLVKSLPLIIRTFADTLKSMKEKNVKNTARTAQDLDIRIIIAGIVVLTLAVWLVPAVPVTLLGAVIVVVFGFFFATVSSRMVGLVGSSNNPVSGMAIATLLATTFLLKSTGTVGPEGMKSAIAIGSIICIIAAISGDTSQDLKTGYLLGATPKKQQIGEVIGVVASAAAIGFTLELLDYAWGFTANSQELLAPQANIMRMVVEGVMEGNLPWNLIFFGAAIAACVEIMGIPVLPFAIGLYLPVSLNACIMIGGLVRLAFDKMNKEEEEKKRIINDGILFCSGMIAGEGLMGIALAFMAIAGTASVIDLSSHMANLPSFVAPLGSILVVGLIILSLLKFTLWNKPSKKEANDEN